MSDISKLPELASLFNVTIDELLGEKSELVERAVKDGLKEYLLMMFHLRRFAMSLLYSGLIRLM